MKTTPLWAVRWVAVRVLLRGILGMAFIMRGTGAGHVNVRLGGLGISCWCPWWRLITVHYLLYVRRHVWVQAKSKQ